MAVMTFTRRQVVDLLPEFLSKRGIGYRPAGEPYARELGISWTALVILGGSFIDSDGEVIARAWYKRRSPYAIKDARPATWAELAVAGLADVVPEGWRLTAKGSDVAAEHRRRVYRYLAGLPMPRQACERAARQLDHLARRIPAGAERAARASRVFGIHPEISSHMRSLSDAAQVLWAFRDDRHIAAWQSAGYGGPDLDVLSYCWSSPPDVTWTRIGGMRTFDELAKALEAKQDRADVERHVESLVRRGDVVRSGAEIGLTAQGQRSRDAIEEETDRAYFAIWDLDDGATATLGDELRAVIDALPKA